MMSVKYPDVVFHSKKGWRGQGGAAAIQKGPAIKDPATIEAAG